MPPVRAILALIIVLGHFSFFGVGSFMPLRNLAPPAVAMFLVISGYGLTRSFKMKGDSYLGGFFRKRMVKILFPAILVAGLHSLLCGGSGAGIGDRVQRIVTGGNTFLPHYWFVWAIVFDYLLFWICHKLFRNPFWQELSCSPWPRPMQDLTAVGGSAPWFSLPVFSSLNTKRPFSLSAAKRKHITG